MKRVGGATGTHFTFETNPIKGSLGIPRKEEMMAQTERRVYVAPDVKQYGAVEEVTQALIESGSGDFFSLIAELLLPGDQPDTCVFINCPS